MTIEERVVKDYGATDNPYLAVWLLRNGALVNGSYEGHQRDRDHHEIGYYFKCSKFHEPGSGTLYLYKFMRRGNMRISFTEESACMDYAAPPTKAQLLALTGPMENAMLRNGTCIRRLAKGRLSEPMAWPAFLSRTARYAADRETQRTAEHLLDVLREHFV